MGLSCLPCEHCGDRNNDYWEPEHWNGKLLVILNMHRIYIRSKDKGRKFIPIAYYCTQCELFQLDKVSQESFDLHERVYYNIKTKEEVEKKRREQEPEYFKLLDKMAETWNAVQTMKEA